MSNVDLTLTITNIYVDDGEEIVNVIEVTVPAPEGDMEEWGEDYLFPHTGTGRTVGDASYFVEVTGSSDPSLLGYQQEWGV